ncbi:MAG: ADP-ribosylation factor family-domain-containing protein [Podila humilis]|nr:MAG: ADP-ribosylation factor family-domain-containing protein [Podila humilis]
MGQSYSSGQGVQETPTIIMRGMENAGKSTLFFHLSQTRPTSMAQLTRWHQETIQCHGHIFVLLDIAAARKVIHIQTKAFQRAAAVIYVVDVSNHENMPNIRKNLEDILLDDMHASEYKTLLILANKQDIPGAMPVSELIEKIGIEEKRSGGAGTWHVQPCCGLTGEGLEEGMKWLVGKYEKQKMKK